MAADLVVQTPAKINNDAFWHLALPPLLAPEIGVFPRCRDHITSSDQRFLHLRTAFFIHIPLALQVRSFGQVAQGLNTFDGFLAAACTFFFLSYIVILRKWLVGPDRRAITITVLSLQIVNVQECTTTTLDPNAGHAVLESQPE